MSDSPLEEEFDRLVERMGLPTPEKEFRFGAHVAGGTGAGLRERLKALNLQDWRTDRAWRKARVLVEIEGGTYGKQVYCNVCHAPVKKRIKSGRLIPVREGGRHNSPEGYANDCQKYNTAALCGWMVLRFTGDMLRDGRAEKTLEDARGMIEE